MRISKKALELELERVPEKVGRLGVRYEQYPTPSYVAADVLWEAYVRGDIEGKMVLDLGCGTGRLAYGVELLGGRALCVELDETLLQESPCLEKAKAFIPYVPSRKVDTVIMNPPYGTKRKKADKPFWDIALELSRSVYSIQPWAEGLFNVIRRNALSKGFKCEVLKVYEYHLKMLYSFHKSRRKRMEVALYHCFKP
ncbi:methyltransferase [Ignicoccus pacificus DSM 13166]|uniref:Methyltransferase n=1 Tax=Ignicoccus pacificus DSM 13166 TaxID=940294 RepID=A0A977K8Y3_9CREN|nr:methyltransferase [Ignicoccus pacificus DSM 13166]